MANEYVYAILVDGTIRYIGRTNDPRERQYHHLRDARAGRYPSSLFHNKLRAALRRGASISQLILHECATVQVAAMVEIRTIKSLGGHTKRGRQLWNTHPGGLGGASEASNAALRLKWQDPAHRKMMSDSASAQLARQRLNPNFEVARRKAASAACLTPEGLARLSAARKKIDQKKRIAASQAAVARIMREKATANGRQSELEV